ncbi:MAG: nucleoside phosphorylase [Clostridia bacterium]|nr:nucleoside phosphorylase [Clostridia bacterium]
MKMITDCYDPDSAAKIEPKTKADAPSVDACIVTFSYRIEEYVLKSYPCRKIGEISFVTGVTPIWEISYRDKRFAFFKTYVGAPACVGTIEDAQCEIRTDRYILFGGCGCLDREITRGRVIVPSAAWRDEGTSYHYAPSSDEICIANADVVEAFMASMKIPYVVGKTWTTDSFYRETEHHIRNRRENGCIAVEMECAGVQAMCDFRGLQLYVFFTSGDLLDAPEWDMRCSKEQITDTQHDPGHFGIALALADAVSNP